MTSIAAAIRQGAEQLTASTSARLDAELLLAHVLKKSKSFLLAYAEQQISAEQYKQYQDLLQQRAKKIPLAYLLGEKEFWSLTFKVTPDVLVPRPDTEILVERILTDYAQAQSLTLIDLGTGSGAIAIALVHEKPMWQIFAGDASEKALTIARKNSQTHLPNRQNSIVFLQSDWLAKFPSDLQVDVIVSNPPYLALDDPHLNDTEISHEPRSALIADKNGLADYEVIAAQAKLFLKPGGRLYFEHGADQAAAVAKILEKNGFSAIQTYTDLSELSRVTVGTQR